MPIDIKVLLVTSPAWPPVWCGRQCWRIKQAPEEIQDGNTQCEHSERKSLQGRGKHYPAGKWMSAVFRRPDTVVAISAQSRARTPGTSSTGPEMRKTLLV